MPLRVAVCTSEFPMATQRSKLGGGVELCVATLGRLHAAIARAPAAWLVAIVEKHSLRLPLFRDAENLRMPVQILDQLVRVEY